MQDIYEKALKTIIIIVTVTCLTCLIVCSVCCITMAQSNKKWIEAVYGYDYPPIITNEQNINH